MKVHDMNDELMNKVRLFDTSGCELKNGYCVDFIGVADGVLYVYGDRVNLEKCLGKSNIDTLIFTKVKQNIFKKVVDEYKLSVKQVFLWKSNLIQDLSPLESIYNLEYLIAYWNTKVSRLWKMSKNSKLLGVSITAYGKIDSLESIEQSTIKEFEIGGSYTTMKYIKLNDYSILNTLPNLEYLSLPDNQISTEHVKQLSKLLNLKGLSLNANIITTEEFAYLRARLKKVEGDSLGPYWMVRNEAVIVGKRKPQLTVDENQERIKKYVREFNKLVEYYEKNELAEPL
ncbi:hypothetical protein RJI07_04680 [Mycoplasmatota bacterium WC30]